MGVRGLMICCRGIALVARLLSLFSQHSEAGAEVRAPSLQPWAIDFARGGRCPRTLTRFEYEFCRLLIIGIRADIEEGRYVSKALPKAVMASVDAFEVRYSLPVVWEPSESVAAQLVERWARYFVREVGKRGSCAVDR